LHFFVYILPILCYNSTEKATNYYIMTSHDIYLQSLKNLRSSLELEYDQVQSEYYDGDQPAHDGLLDEMMRLSNLLVEVNDILKDILDR